VTNQQTETNNS